MKKNGRKTEASLPCKVSTGMFTSERGILVELPDGRRVSALVDKVHVRVDHEPTPGDEVPGRVHVDIVEVRKDDVIVDLPQGGFSDGPRLKVPKSFIS